VREMARALTGWTAEWTESSGLQNFQYKVSRHDNGSKTVFGQKANGTSTTPCVCAGEPAAPVLLRQPAVELLRAHASDEATLAALQGVYLREDDASIRAVVEAILQHPDFLDGPELLTPPVVYTPACCARSAARSTPPPGLAVGGRRTAALLSAECLGLGLHALDGHLDGQGTLGNGELRDRQELPQPVALGG